MAAISAEDARAQIERIRREYSLDGYEKLANLIDSALEILCNELYDSSTHFIQELLQNAGDNHYSSKTPTVMLTYRLGRLRVDCNERGFQPENVEAICAIRHSTKLGQNQSYRVPGADQGLYFLLELSPEYPEDELVDMLLHFDPAQLLFLRRLRHVYIRVVTDNGTKSNLKIRRVDKGKMTTLKVSDAETSFFVSKHRVGNMPLDPRRPNEPTSELVLVFPTSTTEDQPSQGKVYSGLPVGDVPSMKFLLNGSFILTASRLQLDTSSRWNQALRDSVADAFVAAIAQLRANGFRYLWPVFLPSTRESSGFFEPVFTKILETVKAHKMLESSSDDLARPSELVCVNRPEFIYQKDRTPFTLHSATESRYLSDNYPLAATLRAIESLGLRPLSDCEFLDDPTWHHRPHDWHTDLAKAMLRVSQNVCLRNELMHLPIIPLASGERVSTSHDPKPVLMSGEIKPGELPAHEALPIVDALAAQDEDRRELYQRLGLRPIGTDQLCRYICEQHASPLFRPESWSTAHLVAHARLLAKVSWAIDVDLWFATSDNRRVKGSELYLMNQAGKDTGTALGRDPAPQSGRQWEHFLTSKLKVSAIPRLVKIEARTSPCEIYKEGLISSLCDEYFRNMLSFRLSEEFNCILHECRIEDVVEVLNDNWRDYAVWLECGASASRAQKVMTNRLTQDIRNIPVDTSKGRVALKETFVPGLDVFLGDTLVPTLPLRTRGAKHSLRSLREQCCPGFEIVAHVYRRLQGLYDDNEQSIDEFFKAGEFIYVESPSSENDRPDWHWTNIDYCIERDIGLKSQYPGSQHLLQSLLATRKLTIYQLVQKAKKINISTTVQELADIIMAISEAPPCHEWKGRYGSQIAEV
ncbi:HET domain-containing protein [Fusarium sp. Ph1]|nr:HET domain-containing protein [Fusarium sp. Ph1]